MTPRERILAAVRDGLLRAELPGASDDRPAYRGPAGDPGGGSLVARFTRALTALTGHVHHAVHPAAIADAIEGIAMLYHATSYLSWDEQELGCLDLVGLLGSRGLRRVTYDLPADPTTRDEAVRGLDPVPLGLTGATAALADCGALVLVSGPGRGRLASLLPPVHVALLNPNVLYPSLAALLDARPDLVDQGSSMVIVAGPSRTADIEMTLTHGVHGPKHVHVILTA